MSVAIHAFSHRRRSYFKLNSGICPFFMVVTLKKLTKPTETGRIRNRVKVLVVYQIYHFCEKLKCILRKSSTT